MATFVYSYVNKQFGIEFLQNYLLSYFDSFSFQFLFILKSSSVLKKSLHNLNMKKKKKKKKFKLVFEISYSIYI